MRRAFGQLFSCSPITIVQRLWTRAGPSSLVRFVLKGRDGWSSAAERYDAVKRWTDPETGALTSLGTMVRDAGMRRSCQWGTRTGAHDASRR